MSACRACERPVRWVVTESGRRMPLDVEPNPDGNVVVVRGIAVVLGPDARHAGTRYMPHHATCPRVEELRSRARGRRRR